MSQLGLNEVMSYHRVEELPFKFNSVVVKHLKVVLYILSYLHNILVFVDGLKKIDYFLSFFSFGRDRYIKSLFFFNGKA